MKRLIAGALCCGFIVVLPVHATEVYKCKDEKGRLTFSQKPCAKDAEVIKVSGPAQTGTNFAGSDFAEFDANKAKDDKAKAITNIYNRIDSLRAERDRKISNLKRNQGHARNNLAGATYMQSLATEMQSVTDDYNSRIEMEMKEIESLRAVN
jgi:hypothetical protein